MADIDYSQKIPNNVNLAEDRRLQRALEAWQPKYVDWWKEMGPAGFQADDVYLRTAVDVGREGWAHFGHVQMPEYRWGIFLSEPEKDRTIGFGDLKGEPVWQEVPGEYRADLRRLIVVQGDTEPASVEQQRLLGKSAPSLYDLRNLFQVNIEEGRHLWAMVYLLFGYFGREGRDEADAMLERRSGDPDQPRILQAFNEKTPDWLSFFMFTYFTDRDGKYQLGALKESAFDPLSRTCDFMLKEEAHHMFVGASGIGRIIQRTCDLMKEYNTQDVTPHGGINLETIQRYINFHYSVSMDLFGSPKSSNAAIYYSAGLKGRFGEASKDDDHLLNSSESTFLTVSDGKIIEESSGALSLVNDDVRSDYSIDCGKGVRRWNRILSDNGVDFEMRLPHVGFHRGVGPFVDAKISPDGKVLSDEEWEASVKQWLPSEKEQAYVSSLMVPEYGVGKMAGWIAAPSSGINTKPVDFDYVRL